MALYIKNFPEDLQWQLKSIAAELKLRLQDLVTMWLAEDAEKYRKGKEKQ